MIENGKWGGWLFDVFGVWCGVSQNERELEIERERERERESECVCCYLKSPTTLYKLNHSTVMTTEFYRSVVKHTETLF